MRQLVLRNGFVCKRLLLTTALITCLVLLLSWGQAVGSPGYDLDGTRDGDITRGLGAQPTYQTHELGMPTKAQRKAQSGLGAPGMRAGDLYALVVGIAKYKDPKIRQLTVADKDARDFAAFLRSQDRLFRKINVTLLTNEQVTKVEIEKSLHYRLREAGKDDTVVIFWSGHGSDDPRLPGEFFFVTYDADPRFLTATCVNMNQNRVLNRLDSKRVVLIADTCYAGNFTSMGSKSLQPALANFVRDFSESRGRVFLTSSRPDELSLEKTGLSNSVFTHYLIRGLRGEADTDNDGIVSIKELYDYVYQMTKKETRNAQHPQWEARLEGTFPIAATLRSFQPAERTKRSLP